MDHPFPAGKVKSPTLWSDQSILELGDCFGLFTFHGAVYRPARDADDRQKKKTRFIDWSEVSKNASTSVLRHGKKVTN